MTATERAEIAAALDAHERSEALASHRAFSESPHYCGLTLSPLMAATMDAAEGREISPDLLSDETVSQHFGCTRDQLPRLRRALVAVRAGGRAGKTSRLLATKALHAALTVPLPTLAPGERAVALLMAPDLKLSQQILGFVRGYCEGSPDLRSRVTRDTADEIELRRPDGNLVAVRTRAASRGGRGGRGFVLVFAGLDEACFFRDEASGVVNDTEIYRAIAPRLAPGAQCWVVSTPWVAGVGLLEETLARDFGTHEHALCVVAPTRALNPTWDPEGTLEAALREDDPDNADREIGAIPLVSGSQLFFDKVSLDAAVDERRPLSLEPRPGVVRGAGGDFAFRRNSSALAITERTEAGVYDLAHLDEERPTREVPLKPSAVCDRFAVELLRYGCEGVACDSHERDQVSEALAVHALSVYSLPEGQGGKAEQYLLARRLLREGKARLPKHPRLLSQLRAVTAKPAPGGGLTISSPRTSDGAHGDLASAWVASLWAASRATGSDERTTRAGRRR